MARKSGPNRPQTDDGTPYLKMKELVEATGVPWSTIQHYIKQGVLPQPTKTSPNMAYYPPDFADRINTIRRLQTEHGFSLSVIEKLMRERDMGIDLEPLISLRQILFTPSKSQELDLKGFIEATGLKRDQVKACLESGILSPMNDNVFDEEDVAAGIIIHKFLELGLALDDLAFYPPLLTEVVKREMGMRERLTESMPYGEDAEVTAELTQGARGISSYVHNRILQSRAMKRKGLKDRNNKF